MVLAPHKGIFKYKLLIYGINSAFESFQHQIEQVVSGCSRVKSINDNISYGKKICKNMTRNYKTYPANWKNTSSNLILRNASSSQTKYYLQVISLSPNRITPDSKTIIAIQKIVASTMSTMSTTTFQIFQQLLNLFNNLLKREWASLGPLSNKSHLIWSKHY